MNKARINLFQKMKANKTTGEIFPTYSTKIGEVWLNVKFKKGVERPLFNENSYCNMTVDYTMYEDEKGNLTMYIASYENVIIKAKKVNSEKLKKLQHELDATIQ